MSTGGQRSDRQAHRDTGEHRRPKARDAQDYNASCAPPVCSAISWRWIPLEQRGLTEELVRQRRALRQLDGSFFRHYMAVLDARRSSS